MSRDVAKNIYARVCIKVFLLVVRTWENFKCSIVDRKSVIVYNFQFFCPELVLVFLLMNLR